MPEAPTWISSLTSTRARGATRGEARPLHSVFLGGGTPSLFSGGHPASSGACANGAELGRDAEITLEANPGSSGTREAGRLRARRGEPLFHRRPELQTTMPARLGRIHDCRRGPALLGGARQRRIELQRRPHARAARSRTPAAGLADLAAALAAAPAAPFLVSADHRAQHAVLPRSRRRCRRRNVLAELETRGAALLAPRASSATRCRPGRSRGSAAGTTSTTGASATTSPSAPAPTASSRDARRRILRYHKTRQPDGLPGTTGHPPRGARQLDAADRLGEFMLGALRLREGFTPALFEARTGLWISRTWPATRLPALLAIRACWNGRARTCAARRWGGASWMTWSGAFSADDSPALWRLRRRGAGRAGPGPRGRGAVRAASNLVRGRVGGPRRCSAPAPRSFPATRSHRAPRACARRRAPSPWPGAAARRGTAATPRGRAKAGWIRRRL
jgi:hypothetical protein